MSVVLNDIITEFESDDLLQTLYRIESHQSNQNMQVEDNGMIFCNDSSMYTYFSITERHHYYFTEKKLNNYLKIYLKRKVNLKLDKKIFLDDESYGQVKNLVIQDGFYDNYNFRSIKMHVPCIFQILLSENAIAPKNKHLYLERLPERSDPKMFRGGYGICGPWLDLLMQLTFLYESHTLDEKDYLKYLETKRNLSQNGFYNSKGKNFFLDDVYYQLRINEDVFSPYHKYSIINSLEQIKEEGLYLPKSKLETEFRTEVRNVLYLYETTREKVLRKFEEEYKKYL